MTSNFKKHTRFTRWLAPLLIGWMILFGLAFPSFGQPLNVDSLLQVAQTTDSLHLKGTIYLEISREYRKTNLDTSAYYINKAIQTASRIRDKSLYHRVKMSQAALFWIQGQQEEASKNYRNALVFWQDKGDQVEIARCLLNLGNVSHSMGDHQLAVEYLTKAQIVADEANEKLMQAQTVGTLGNVFFSLENFDSSLYYRIRTIEIFAELNDSTNLARSYTNLGYHYQETGQSYQALPQYHRALEFLAGTDENGLKGEVYQGLGITEYRIGHFSEATEHFLQSREYFGNLGWYRKIAANQILVGLCFKLMGRTETAREVWEEAYHLADSVGASDFAANALSNLGDLDREEGNDEKAIQRYRMALEIGKDDNQRFAQFMGLGLSFKETGSADSAKKYISLALDLARKNNNELELGTAFYDQAHFAFVQGDARECVQFLDSAFQYLSINQHPRGLRDSYTLKSQCLEKMGDFIGALNAERSAAQWQDSMSSADVNESLLALEAEMWSEKKEHTLKMAKKNEELQTKEAERIKEESEKLASQRNLLISILIFLLVIGISGYYFYIKRKQTKLQHKISELRIAALRSQMNPHFIFNALGSMQLLINTNKSMEANNYLSKFARLLRMILENSASAELTLEEEIEALRLYVELEALRFKFQYDFKFEEALNLNEIQIPGMLIQPFVENAIKHGISGKKEAGRLLLEFKASGDQLVCCVEDNGIGRKASAKIKREAHGHPSRGIQIIEEQLALIRPFKPDRLKIIDMEDASGQAAGTRVEIRIPMKLSTE